MEMSPSWQNESPLDTSGTSNEAQRSAPLHPSAFPSEEFSFSIDDEPQELIDNEMPLIAPFQVSHAMPKVAPQARPSDQVPSISARSILARKGGKNQRFSFPMIILLACAIAIVGILIMSALVQATPPLPTKTNRPASQARPSVTLTASIPMGKPTRPSSGPNQTPLPISDWVPQHLPAGWTHAGLTVGDALQAERTAMAFNDREMSLDYRSSGTRNHHAGTFTAATFLLTIAAMQRFQQNDVRAINNRLFDQVAKTKLIRAVIDAQPHVVRYATQGQQQFAWVNVTFQLWQSHLDPNDPLHQRRIEGKENDPVTNQPRLHHLLVLLLHVPPQTEGANPPMGGTGWLVSNYALDQADGTLPEIVQPA